MMDGKEPLEVSDIDFDAAIDKAMADPPAELQAEAQIEDEGVAASEVAAAAESTPVTPAELPAPAIEVWSDEPATRVAATHALRLQSRRDFTLFGLGAVAAAAGLWWITPGGVKQKLLSPDHAAWLDSLEVRAGLTADRREHSLNRVLTFDDDVAEALYSRNRSVRTYRRSDVENLRSNSAGRLPSPAFLPTWSLRLSGLAAGSDVALSPTDLARFTQHEQVTRLCCVEGWSAVAWWGGLRFADLIAAHPPAPGMRWAAMESAVSVDGAGRTDPYYVSIDLATAQHPQTLLATRQNGQTLSLAHGAPLRLVVPMKLGLKNIKHITSITWTREEPRDFWGERGYSKYDGL